MHRSLLPFILAILGFTLFLWSKDKPFFEWEISEIVADLPSEYQFKTSLWITRLGESVVGPSWGDDYVFWHAYVPAEGFGTCSPEGLHPIVRRSSFDEAVDHASVDFYQKVLPWLFHPLLFGFLLFLCGIYIWWFTYWFRRPIYESTVGTVIVVVIFCWLLAYVWHPLMGRVAPGWPCSTSYSGTVTFSARLAKVHYETLIVLFAGLVAEFGSLGIILQQAVKAIIQRKESSKSAVG